MRADSSGTIYVGGKSWYPLTFPTPLMPSGSQVECIIKIATYFDSRVHCDFNFTRLSKLSLGSNKADKWRMRQVV